MDESDSEKEKTLVDETKGTELETKVLSQTSSHKSDVSANIDESDDDKEENSEQPTSGPNQDKTTDF